jgi:hypothetical protein
MKQKIKLLIVIIMLGLVFVHATAVAQGIVPCGRRAQGPDGQCTINGLKTLAINVVNYLIAGAGLVAMAFILWGGIQMLLSGGSPERIKAGKTTLFNALLGLVIVLASYILINFLVFTLTGGQITNFSDLLKFWTPS